MTSKVCPLYVISFCTFIIGIKITFAKVRSDCSECFSHHHYNTLVNKNGFWGWGGGIRHQGMGGRGGCLPPKSEVENMTSSFLDMRRHRKNEQAGASICRFFPCIWWTVDFVCYPGVGWQECAEAIPGQQLPEHNTSEALHLHHAHAAGWWLEPDPVQLVGLHTPRLRYQLHRDPPSPGKDTVEFLCMVLFDLLNTKFFLKRHWQEQRSYEVGMLGRRIFL